MADRESRGVARTRVSRDVEPAALTDLLEHPPPATVAFVDRDAVDILPVCARFSADTHLFGVAAGVAPDLDNREVVLVIDDGPYWFELRGISVRGVAQRVNPPGQGGAQRLTWYALKPRRILAWDYGSIRQE